jgi:hypothetical protein
MRRPDGIPRLRLWDDALSFGHRNQPSTWTVFVPFEAEKGDPIVREATWQRAEDLQLLRDLVERFDRVVAFDPTIVIHDAIVPAAELDGFLREAASFRVAPVWLEPRRAIRCDVGSVGFDFFGLDDPPAIMRFQWSVDPPGEWTPLVQWAGRLRRFLEGHLAGTRPERPRSGPVAFFPSS